MWLASGSRHETDINECPQVARADFQDVLAESAIVASLAPIGFGGKSAIIGIFKHGVIAARSSQAIFVR